ncbi:MAG: MerR family transcriptional regulator [Firmicutes bacterium]|nr:MerR family transcriptional regulator [Bacillota bacterium]
MEQNNLFTIAQAANACGISRATLLRMEGEGLLAPVRDEDSRYRYYSTLNILQAIQIYNMHRLGLTRREIRPIVDTPDEIGSVIEKLESMRDNLSTIIAHLKKRSLQDPSEVTELLQIPETLCYIKVYELPGGRYDLRQYLMETISEAVQAGCRLNADRGPFMRVYRPDLAEGQFTPGLYRYYFCVPIRSHPKDCANIEAVQSRQIVSVTWHGRVTDLPDRTLTLAEEARGMGLTPSGWFHVILVLLNAPADMTDERSQILQLGCITE